MNKQWTGEQAQAIESRSQTLLVSAAAGSGKTAVLVERILQKLMDSTSPVRIDRLLVVTFTNAAAAQLKDRIRKALEKRLAEHPDDTAAIRQLNRLPANHIETIDRFCREVVLDHYQEIGIDPTFRIQDAGEMKLLQAEAVSRTIEEAYCLEGEKGKAFHAFADGYCTGKTDSGLDELILRFYDFSMSHEFPRLWRAQCIGNYTKPESETEWMRSMLEEIRTSAAGLAQQAAEARRICEMPEGPAGYLPSLRKVSQFLEDLSGCTTVDAFRDAFAFKWPMIGRAAVPKNADSAEAEARKRLAEAVKKMNDEMKNAARKLRDMLFFASDEACEEMRRSAGSHLRVLAELTDRFEELYTQMKTERGAADFSDVSHNALRILLKTEKNGLPVLENGKYVPSDTARAYASYFDEIYIDEYQDSNPVQEVLLWSVSKEALSAEKKEYNRFMVGDVKQSIYRFRMAEPGLFMEKADRYPDEDGHQERRIDLSHNFRSRACVINCVNRIFDRIMRRDVGGIEYTAREALRPGFPYPEYPLRQEELLPEFILVKNGLIPQARRKEEAEARIVAERIRQLVGTFQVYDRDEASFRPARYGDMAILLRTSGRWAEAFARELARCGIPNRSGANTGYFDTVEVRTVLSYLNVLDNPDQDIPLAASLRSPIGHLTDEELAFLRIEGGKVSLFSCVLAVCGSCEQTQLKKKLETFLHMTKKLRNMVRDTPIHQLLWLLFDETGYMDAVTAMPGGAQRRANLELLVDKAIAFEETSYRGLFHFVRYIEKLKKDEIDFGEAQLSESGDDYVQIMTMHKSKGLEFPIVFVSGLTKKFNLQDTSGALVLHAKLGAGLSCVDPALRIKNTTRVRNAVAARIRSDSIGEELRVLYVAMTRAQEKLILTASMDDPQDFLQKAAVYAETRKLPATSILGAQNMAAWVGAALGMPDEDGRIHFEKSSVSDPEMSPPAIAAANDGSESGYVLRYVMGEDVLRNTAAGEAEKEALKHTVLSVDPNRIYDRSLAEALKKNLAWRYPFAADAEIPGKLSVSAIKRSYYETEMGRLDQSDDGAALSGTERMRAADDVKPRFLLEEDKNRLSGAEIGTAYHQVLAALDLAKKPVPGDVSALLESMVKCGRIQKEEAAAVRAEKIERFLDTALAKRMRLAARNGVLYREQPFVITRKAGEVLPEWKNSTEKILIQGIIDAYFFENDEIILVDYKTDSVKTGEENILTDRYRVQFQLYRDALQMMLGRPVTQAWLYSLHLNKAIYTDLTDSAQAHEVGLI